MPGSAVCQRPVVTNVMCPPRRGARSSALTALRPSGRHAPNRRHPRLFEHQPRRRPHRSNINLPPPSPIVRTPTPPPLPFEHQPTAVVPHRPNTNLLAPPPYHSNTNLPPPPTVRTPTLPPPSPYRSNTNPTAAVPLPFEHQSTAAVPDRSNTHPAAVPDRSNTCPAVPHRSNINPAAAPRQFEHQPHRRPLPLEHQPRRGQDRKHLVERDVRLLGAGGVAIKALEHIVCAVSKVD